MIRLDINTYFDGRGLARLEVAGEIDGDTADQVVQAVEKVLGGDALGAIQVDFSGVTFLGSAGIRALLTARRIAGEHGVALCLTEVHGYVLEVLKIMGLLDLLGRPPAKGSAALGG
ncbi:STAS domain-containing protein [Actinoplanes subtropicus]|uniref:STAS domain-containing protein n=1 Tax=Actinoplanes subtropicus TaxID=543632 RepID=UPI000AFE2047|nr:STAS domain-containing protein [Actinoplanes subtropicus]